MSTSRRDFLKNTTKSMLLYTSLPAGFAVAGNEYQSDLYSGVIPICQNMTNEISAQFTVLTEGKNPYAYRVKDAQGRDLSVRKWDEEHRKDSGYGIDKLIVERLQADQLYYLQVIDKDRGTVLDERIFKSLPLNRKMIPTLATWDDHDYGENNQNKYYSLKTQSKRIFECFFGSMPVAGYQRGHGVGAVLTGFGQRFFLMDDRYFRDEPHSGGMMWGSAQQEWLLASLKENDKPSWLMNGSQYFSSYVGNESFQKEYMRNPRREVHTWKHNFMIMKSEVLNGGLKTDSYCLGRRGQRLISHSGTIRRT